MILAIDPGTFESAYVIMGEDLKPIEFDKVENNELLKLIQNIEYKPYTTNHFAIEMIAHYGSGMPAGREVFDTCVWIGRFYQAACGRVPRLVFVYRKDVKMNLCQSMKAKDSNIIQALIDRFAYGVPNRGKGSKKNPGWFYGFKKDIWQAYALAVTYYDLYCKEEKNGKNNRSSEMLELNKIYNMDCLDGMKRIPDGFVDLTVTSPPYDNLRTYNGNIEQWSFEKFQAIAKELYRVTKQGGVVVWIVGDATVKGSETGTSFKQALYFKEIGFNLHDTMIYKKTKFPPIDPTTAYRYTGCFEYMFVFSKGKPKCCNYIKEKCKHAGKRAVSYQRSKNDKLRYDRKEKNKNHIVNDYKIKCNVWEYASCSVKGHPAPFPEQLANDHILSWSNEGDVVLDPFLGSGTTAKMALLNNRNFIGFELNPEYCKIAEKRIEPYLMQQTIF